MSSPEAPRRVLPAHPSADFIRKQAKRRAKADAAPLGHAQRAIAHEYGFRSWAALMRAVDEAGASPLSIAAARGDGAAVRALLAEGASVDGDALDTPLFRVCASAAPPADRLAIAAMLIEAGAFVRRGCTGGATPLHAAARRGPAALVRLLLKHGALFWQADDKGARPFDYARKAKPLDRDEILMLLADGPRITDPLFRAAVSAVQAGDIAALTALLDAHPRLLRERAIEPELGPRGYFSDPKLFWFVANNPTLIPQAPPNIAAVAEAMLARGVAREDLDYTLELLMTNALMPPAQQLALLDVLTRAGAQASPNAMVMSLGHKLTAPVLWLIERGQPVTAELAAGLGRAEALGPLLAAATPTSRAAALALAVINHHTEAARLCLDAGADPSALMPVQAHSTPLHQAALDGDLPTLRLLLERGARLDVLDTMWRGTPLGWALHGGQAEAAALLRAAAEGAAGAG